MRAIKLVFWLLCFSLCSVPLFGSVVTSGFIQVTGGGAIQNSAFSLSGSGFAATGDFAVGFLGGCLDCTEGTVLTVDGDACCSDFGGGAPMINGATFTNVVWGSLLQERPSVFFVTGPGIVLDQGAGTYFGPFSFTGRLCGSTDLHFTCNVDLPSLTGSGQVAVQISSIILDGETLLNPTGATYTFQSTPEPSSLLLLGSGVLGLAGVIRRKINL